MPLPAVHQMQAEREVLTATAAAEPLGLDRPLHKQAEELLHVEFTRRRAPAWPIVRRRPAPSSRGRRAQELRKHPGGL